MPCHDTSSYIAARYSVVDLPLFDAHDARLRPPPSIGRMSQEEEELEAAVAAEERVCCGRTPKGRGEQRAFAPEHSLDGGEAAKGCDGGGRGIAAQGGEGAAAFDAAAALLLTHSAAGAPHRGATRSAPLAHPPPRGGENEQPSPSRAAPSPPSLVAAAVSAREREHSGQPILSSPASAHGHERPKTLDRSASSELTLSSAALGPDKKATQRRLRPFFGSAAEEKFELNELNATDATAAAAADGGVAKLARSATEGALNVSAAKAAVEQIRARKLKLLHVSGQPKNVQPMRVLICGWRRDVQDMLRVFNRTVPPGSEVHILFDSSTGHVGKHNRTPAWAADYLLDHFRSGMETKDRSYLKGAGSDSVVLTPVPTAEPASVAPDSPNIPEGGIQRPGPRSPNSAVRAAWLDTARAATSSATIVTNAKSAKPPGPAGRGQRTALKLSVHLHAGSTTVRRRLVQARRRHRRRRRVPRVGKTQTRRFCTLTVTPTTQTRQTASGSAFRARGRRASA